MNTTPFFHSLLAHNLASDAARQTSIHMNIRKLIVTATLALATTIAAHAGPITKGGFIISKPGKYFLTKNINALIPLNYNSPVGIVIQTSDVELDLAGFTIGPTNNLGIGIYLVNGVSRVRIHNGRVQGVQTAVLSEVNGAISSCLFERLQIAECTNDSFRIKGQESVVRSCIVTKIAVQHHGMIILTSLGSFSEVSDCTLSSTLGASTGINAGLTDGLVVRRCVVEGFEEGIRVTPGCKLFDNLTLHCTNPIVGNPVLVGSNN